jgi:quercetin dioxygenase-like cupin family protein
MRIGEGDVANVIPPGSLSVVTMPKEEIMTRMRGMQAAVLSGVFAAGAVLGAAFAQVKKEVVHVDSGKANFKEVAPGVSKMVLWGNPDKGPYGTFTRFAPGLANALHTHMNDIRIVVLNGAYIYKPEKGDEVRVAAGHYIFVPGGSRHVSSGDAKEGALFYEESMGKFDLNPVK